MARETIKHLQRSGSDGQRIWEVRLVPLPRACSRAPIATDVIVETLKGMGGDVQPVVSSICSAASLKGQLSCSRERMWKK
jgi:hypothetical protein